MSGPGELICKNVPCSCAVLEVGKCKLNRGETERCLLNDSRASFLSSSPGNKCYMSQNKSCIAFRMIFFSSNKFVKLMYQFHKRESEARHKLALYYLQIKVTDFNS